MSRFIVVAPDNQLRALARRIAGLERKIAVRQKRRKALDRELEALDRALLELARQHARRFVRKQRQLRNKQKD